MKKLFLSIMVVTALALSGCGAIFPAPQPTPLPPEMIGTAIVQTQEGIAAETQANAPLPTETLRPTRTLLPTETPRATWTPTIELSSTPTFVITIPAIHTLVPPTATLHTFPYEPLPGYQAANGCDLVARSPKWGEEFPQGVGFDAAWTFANYGPYTWDPHEVDFKYLNGEPMYENIFSFDLPTAVKPGERIKLIVDMVAPLKAGTYTSTWLLSEGARFYCQVSVRITVK